LRKSKIADEEIQPQIVHVPMNIPFPSKLDMKGNVATNWKRFKRVWENYEIASGLKTKENEKVGSLRLQLCFSLFTMFGVSAIFSCFVFSLLIVKVHNFQHVHCVL
jgi:hypothetical protein